MTLTWVSNCCLTPNDKFQLYHGESKLHLMYDNDVCFVLDNIKLSWICIVLTHWNNNPTAYMALHSNPLSLSELLRFNDTRLVGNTLSHLLSLVWSDWSPNTRHTYFFKSVINRYTNMHCLSVHLSLSLSIHPIALTYLLPDMYSLFVVNLCNLRN